MYCCHDCAIAMHVFNNRTVVSRDTIFQNLGLEGVKSRLETLKSRKTSVSRGCFYKLASKLNDVTKENNF